MVAKIGRGKNLFGALQYNQLKVDGNEGQVLYTHKVHDTPDGNHSITNFARAFEPYLIANRRTEKPVLHISLNPDPKDNVTDVQFSQLAREYMRKMGYGDQPFAVFKHTDIDRSHIHIVSVCVDGEGKKISDTFEHNRSMSVCRELEKKYGLTPATEKGQTQNDTVFRPVDYRAGDLKSQLASVVRHLPNHYRFQTFGEYNALLSLFNITAEKVEGELHGQQRRGLVYFALDENEKKASNPFKASLFGKYAGFTRLQQHMEESQEKLKGSEARPRIKEAIIAAIGAGGDETNFRKQLEHQGSIPSSGGIPKAASMGSRSSTTIPKPYGMAPAWERNARPKYSTNGGTVGKNRKESLQSIRLLLRYPQATRTSFLIFWVARSRYLNYLREIPSLALHGFSLKPSGRTTKNRNLPIG